MENRVRDVFLSIWREIKNKYGVYLIGRMEFVIWIDRIELVGFFVREAKFVFVIFIFVFILSLLISIYFVGF